ncbi:VOC family protein [Candidatus Micrarchaeota archaeon]|nr:VOC family protein [Candidatus Micrarchaeota archaeon]
MTSINPYLGFKDNCEEAFNFYKSVFGCEFSMLVRFKDMPSGPGMTKAEEQKIMHVSLPIGKGSILMGSDWPSHMGNPVIGNNFSISINTESEKEVDRLFKGLSAGGKITMPVGKVSWGSYFGMFSDKFGINWMVSYDYPKK